MIISKRILILIMMVSLSMSYLFSQSDTTYLNITSQMCFVSELDRSVIMMDEEGNQFDHYINYIEVAYQNKKLRIPYNSNYIFWDEYDDNMNVKKLDYKIVIRKVVTVVPNQKEKIQHSLFKVFYNEQLIYNATLNNPYLSPK